ncbi:uncharacterized protein LOC134539230 [Bacillus rossius redtenbacheri]|uniref:uncharacterized protein LOC134539230 n=1 Tax=Bacillus rossius redtenbacheri TaxID=93214 RepID=UPI002FDCE0E6
MSARVFNPAVMSQLRKDGHSPSGPAGQLQRVRRDLFGPVDHADVEEVVRRELSAQQARDADRWGFDFGRGSPRRQGPGTSRWVWKKVLPGEQVALPYAHRRLSYLNTAADKSPEQTATTSEPAAALDNNNKQSHITDYMKAKKRPCSGDSKPATAATEQPPPKQAKTSS